MSRSRFEVRNALIRQRRAQGAMLKTIAAEFGISVANVAILCSGVRPVAGSQPAPSNPPHAGRVPSRIQPDEGTRAEIEAAIRERAHVLPYKSARAWPA